MQAQQARADTRTAFGLITRSKRLLNDGEQEQPALASQTGPDAPDSASSVAQIMTQLNALTIIERQAGTDGTSSDARQTRVGGSAGSSAFAKVILYKVCSVL